MYEVVFYDYGHNLRILYFEASSWRNAIQIWREKALQNYALPFRLVSLELIK